MRPFTRLAVPVLLAAALVLLCLDVGRLALAPTREASIDAVRIRNAMVAELGRPGDTAWTPETVPADFNWETRPAPPYFARIAAEIIPPEARDLPVLEKAVRIARQLRRNAHTGEPIQSDTRETYEKIIAGQGGYCSDYTQSFNALALAAGLKVREWGFSWETMANGHAFNEVWDPERGKWLLIDSFVSFYPVDAASGEPLSALEFRAALMDAPGAATPKLVRIVPDRFEFKTDEKAMDWYRRGVPRMFLLLGNNVYSYDADPLIRLVEPLPRSLEMVVAILNGEHPRFLFVPPAFQPDLADEVAAQVEAMHGELYWVLAKLAAIVVLGLALLVSLWRLWRHRGGRATTATEAS